MFYLYEYDTAQYSYQHLTIIESFEYLVAELLSVHLPRILGT